ncbi:MAG TPA: VTT domain-containing protein, partial [Candidatus Angelobacter sp.]|nr:VTT domain-containing protein [Candidatus Angelobacter sp.]
FFKRFGAVAVFFGRLLPVIRTFIALPAGIARMPRLRFHLYTFAGSWPWCFALAWIGMKLGERWETDPRLKQWFHRMDAVIVLILLAGIIWFVWSHWKGRVRVTA